MSQQNVHSHLSELSEAESIGLAQMGVSAAALRAGVSPVNIAAMLVGNASSVTKSPEAFLEAYDAAVAKLLAPASPDDDLEAAAQVTFGVLADDDDATRALLSRARRELLPEDAVVAVTPEHPPTAAI